MGHSSETVYVVAASYLDQRIPGCGKLMPLTAAACDAVTEMKKVNKETRLATSKVAPRLISDPFFSETMRLRSKKKYKNTKIDCSVSESSVRILMNYRNIRNFVLWGIAPAYQHPTDDGCWRCQFAQVSSGTHPSPAAIFWNSDREQEEVFFVVTCVADGIFGSI